MAYQILVLVAFAACLAGLIVAFGMLITEIRVRLTTRNTVAQDPCYKAPCYKFTFMPVYTDCNGAHFSENYRATTIEASNILEAANKMQAIFGLSQYTCFAFLSGMADTVFNTHYSTEIDGTVYYDRLDQWVCTRAGVELGGVRLEYSC